MCKEEHGTVDKNCRSPQTGGTQESALVQHERNRYAGRLIDSSSQNSTFEHQNTRETGEKKHAKAAASRQSLAVVSAFTELNSPSPPPPLSPFDRNENEQYVAKLWSHRLIERTLTLAMPPAKTLPVSTSHSWTVESHAWVSASSPILQRK